MPIAIPAIRSHRRPLLNMLQNRPMAIFLRQKERWFDVNSPVWFGPRSSTIALIGDFVIVERADACGLERAPPTYPSSTQTRPLNQVLK